MRVRLLAFVIWAAIAASAMFWALRMAVSSPSVPAHAMAVGVPGAPQGDLARLLGAAPTRVAPGAVVAVESSQASRFKLLGVAAPRRGGDRNGLALIAIDGKPARSYAVGAQVDGDLVLQAVHQRGAKLGTAGASPLVSLELPALPMPATGSLPLLPAAAPPLPVMAAPPVPLSTAPAPVDLPLAPPATVGGAVNTR